MRHERTQTEGETLRNLYLVGTLLEDLVFTDCEFLDSAFLSVELRNCTFRNCKFRRCRIETPKAYDVSLQNTELYGCAVSGVQFYELAAQTRFIPPFSTMRACVIRYSTFAEMKFPKFDFSDNEIIESTFAACNLAGASFRNARLDRTEFFQCDLSDADFRDALAYNIDVLTCKVRRARFSMPDAMNLLTGLGIRLES